MDYTKPERAISKIYIHCSASSQPEYGNIETVTRWHEARGFDGIGYHYLIPFDGTLLVGRDIEKPPAAQKGHNTGTIAICVHGLRQEDFKVIQIETLKKLCNAIVDEDPNITVHGHSEVSDKLCPVFDYKRALELGPHGHMPPSAKGYKSLDMFDSGYEVVKLQQRLNLFFQETDFPIFLNPLTKLEISVDGIFGQETAQAILQFQMIKGLTPTGYLDRQTELILPAREA